MIPLAIIAAILGLLVWAGRRPARVDAPLRGFRAAAAGLRRLAALMAAPGVGTLSESDARAILGVGAGAGRSDIESAYRRLIRLAHPDAGGTVGLAAQLNAARDRLTR